METCMSNLKSVALTVLKLLPLNIPQLSDDRFAVYAQADTHENPINTLSSPTDFVHLAEIISNTRTGLHTTTAVLQSQYG